MLKKITKNTSILSFGTGISMLLGFVRNVLLAHFFGTSALLEAFIVAFRLPNLFRSIFGEGFADSVATPILSEIKDNKKELFKTSNNLLSLCSLVLFLFTLIGIFCAKYLVTIIAFGFLDDPSKFALTVSFTRITFLYLFFIGLSVNSFSILYSLKRFFIPAITPAFLNVSFIIGLLFFSRYFKNYILVICVLIGGILQVIVPFYALKKRGFKFKLNLKTFLKDKILHRMLKLFPPRIISSIVYQLSVVVDTFFASFGHIVGGGAVAALWFANTYIHLPMGLFIHSICRVAIVDLSYYHSKGDMEDFKKLFVFSFQNIIFFIVPIAVVYIFLSEAIIDVVLKRGDFDLYSLKITSSVLFYYSFGLFFFCGIKLLVNTFYALKDTATPAKITITSLIINIILSAAFMHPLKIGGVALGSSLAAIFNFFVLHRILLKKIGKIKWGDTRLQFLKVLFLSLLIAVIGRYFWDCLGYQKYIKALFVAGFSLGIFITGGYIFGLKQIQYFKQLILSRKKASPCL